MVPEFGFISLLIASIITFFQSICGIRSGLLNKSPFNEAITLGAVRAQFIVVTAAFAALIWSHCVSDFSVLNVILNSNSSLPALYKFAGSWGSHEGSMLLWVFVLAAFGIALPSPASADNEAAKHLRLATLGVQGIISFSFLLFIILTSNPFLRVLPPALEGQDLNPILQDPYLAIHPPLLYFGYVGFSSVFAIAAGALLTKNVTPAWARSVRPYALVAWAFLTGGIALGSHWAYTELGWGGWWFWDPVENAALMPWLAGTALIHAIIVLEKRDILKNWTVFLALLSFVLSLLGTFLVRSGVITSVHSFATDPRRGLFILILLSILSGGAFTLFAMRASSADEGDSRSAFAFISRESAFIINNLLLSAIAVTVVLGTLYPYMLELLTGHKISVGPPYFILTVIPLACPLLVLMALAPRLTWQKSGLDDVLHLVKSSILPSGALILAIALWQKGWPLAAWPFTMIAVAIIVSVSPSNLRAWQTLPSMPRRAGMMLAHIGFAMALLGMVGDSFGKIEKTIALAKGEQTVIGSCHVMLKDIQAVQGPNYRTLQAFFDIVQNANGKKNFSIISERRFYPASNQDVTKAGIYTTGLADLYIAMGNPQTNNGTTTQLGFRLSYHPLLPLLWGGSVFMVAGALITAFASLWQRFSKVAEAQHSLS